ncbi:MAG: tetratricopeptide repeat protein [Sporomusaceae bacterium]|nr:tetratricopeptide repeat protein [Sporomusaceae bacterium]
MAQQSTRQERKRKEAEKQFAKALALHQAGKLEEAVRAYERTLRDNPQKFEAQANLGLIYETNQKDKAIAAYEEAFLLAPRDPRLGDKLSRLYIETGNFAKAKILLKDLLELEEKNWQAALLLGRLHKQDHEFDLAFSYYEKVALWQPDLAEAYAEMGNISRYSLKETEALAYFRQAIDKDPENAEYHGYLLEALLYFGHLPEGFKELEWRKKLPKGKDFYDQFDQNLPQWQGEIFSGKKLLIYCEEGLGDTVQFVRYLPLVKLRGGHVTLACQKPLLRLFEALPGVDAVVNSCEWKDYDLSVALLSLPMIFGTSLATIPASTPYIKTPRPLVTAWQEKLAALSGPKIGVIWSGNSHNTCHIGDLAPLSELAKVNFVSLQKGTGASEWPEKPAALSMINLDEELSDFADTAAVMLNLDLIISTDTSTAHLAGALGRPVLTLLSEEADWRWLAKRTDSPWYPTMRLVRKEPTESWLDLWRRVAQGIEKNFMIERDR